MNQKATVSSCLVKQFGLVGLTFFSAFVSTSAQKAEPRPNIILIMSDDQAWGDVEINGNKIIDTPNLNKLASEGVQFERFFVNPMCAPTRASLMTGRYNLRTGASWVGRRTEMLSLNEVTVADILSSNGYATGCFGKWHLGSYGPYHPNERGFDNFTGFLHGATDDYFNTDLFHNNKEFTSDAYITNVLTDSAMKFIESSKNKPFFCYIPYNVPHHPFQVPEKYLQKYKDKGVADTKTASLYGMVDNMDENIGRILALVDRLKLAENTVIIFLSDNGPAFERFNDGLTGIKAEVGEGSVRVPFFIKWKGNFPAGKRVFEIAAHIDFLPTILDITGINVPEGVKLDGVSVLPLIKDGSYNHSHRMIFTHQTVFGTCLMTPGGLRTNDYRLLNWKNGYELYDMNTDPYQKRNIAAVCPDLTKKLINAYESWYKEVTDHVVYCPPVPLGYPGYDKNEFQAPDALISDNLKYNGKYGWYRDYIVNWTSTDDTIIWQVDVLNPGEYEFVLEYNCPQEDLGAVVQLSCGKQKISRQIATSKSGPPTLLKGTLENNKKAIEWTNLSLGKMKLKPGTYNMLMQAIKIPGKTVCEVQSLQVIKTFK